jgi:hypothetical protein
MCGDDRRFLAATRGRRGAGCERFKVGQEGFMEAIAALSGAAGASFVVILHVEDSQNSNPNVRVTYQVTGFASEDEAEDAEDALHQSSDDGELTQLLQTMVPPPSAVVSWLAVTRGGGLKGMGRAGRKAFRS